LLKLDKCAKLLSWILNKNHKNGNFSKII
jgi:hypothetical protein